MKIKQIIINSIKYADYMIALLVCKTTRRIEQSNTSILVPAGILNGGFGDDIMTASFLHNHHANVILHTTIIGRKTYLDNKKIIGVLTTNYYRPFTSIIPTLKQASDLYVIGADILDGVYENNKHRFRLMHLANNLGINVHLTGFSIRTEPSSYFVKHIPEVSKFTEIKLRDSESFKRAACFFPKINFAETTDMAFCCPTLDVDIDTSTLNWISIHKKKGKKIIAYCPNTIQANKVGLQEYIDGQVKLLQNAIVNNCVIVCLYHDLRKYVLNMSDKELSKMICETINSDCAIFVDDIPDGVILKSYINLCDFTITGRMHFGISGYTLGLPMFGVCYYNKFEGVQKLFKLDVDDSLVDYIKVSEESDKIFAFLKKFEIYKVNVKDNIGKVQQIAKLNFE